MITMAAIWGLNFSVVKSALAELPPLAFNALRFPLAVVAMVALLHSAVGGRWPDKEDLARILLLGIVGNVAYQLCFIIGIDWTRAGNASLLLSTTPIWTVLLSAAAGHELPNRWVVGGVTAMLVGMVMVVVGGGDELSLSSASLRGDLLMVVASILWSVYTVWGRAPVEKYGSLRMTAWTLYAGTPVLIVMGLPDVAALDWSSISPAAWGGVVYAGILAIAVAYLLWYRGVERLGNNRTAIYSNLVPVFALITAWLWLEEVPTALQIGGASVIVGGLSAARWGQSPGPSLREGSAAPRSER